MNGFFVAANVAIEKTKRYAAYPNLTSSRTEVIVQGDAIQLDWLKLVGKKPWKLILGIAVCTITSYALRLGLWSKHPPECIVVLVQKKVARTCHGA